MTDSSLAVIHEAAPTGRRAIRLLRRMSTGTCHVVALPGGSAGDSTVRQFRAAFPDRLSEIDARPFLERVSTSVREDLVRFTAEWPDRVWQGESFKQRFVDQEVSLWWLTALSEKNNEDRPTFALLCDLELVRTILDSSLGPVSQAVIVTHCPDFYAVCERLLAARGIRVLGPKPRVLFGRDTIPVLIAQRLRRFVSWSARVLAARRLGRADRAEPAETSLVAFYTWYPSQWVRKEGVKVDRYYGDLPNYLSTTHGVPVVYAASGQGVSFREHVQALREGRRGGHETPRIEFLERHLHVRDVVLAFWGSVAPLRYLWLELANRQFRQSFMWKGLNCFEILRRDLRVSFLERIPDHLLVAKQVERFARTWRPRILVTYLELYCHGRAVICGTKRGSPRTVTVGYQHSAITRNKIFYRFEPHELAGAGAPDPDFVNQPPTPDRFAVTGPFGARVLAEGGYPADKAWVIGSPRFDGLRDAAVRTDQTASRRRELGIEPSRFVVLVTGTIFRDATLHLIEQSLLALRARPQCFALFKFHPFNQRDAGQLQRLAAQHGCTSYRITDVDVHSLLTMADALISSHSATTAEAIAAGVPVINMRSGYLDLSPLADGREAAWEVWDDEGIVGALDDIERRAPQFGRIMANRAAFIDGMFTRLDGRACERFANKLLDVLAS